MNKYTIELKDRLEPIVMNGDEHYFDSENKILKIYSKTFLKKSRIFGEEYIYKDKAVFDKVIYFKIDYSNE